MILLVFALQVVVAHHVQAVGEALGVLLPQQVLFAADIGILQSAGDALHPLFHLLGHDDVVQAVPEGADAVGDGTAGVQGADGFGQLGGPYVAVVQAAALGDLIAGGPDRHAGMAAVPLHKGGQILFPVGGEILVVIAGLLAHAPGVEGLVKHIHAQPVAGLDQGGGRRIMGGADGVEAHFLELFHLAGLGVIDRHNTDGAIVVMQAAAL